MTNVLLGTKGSVIFRVIVKGGKKYEKTIKDIYKQDVFPFLFSYPKEQRKKEEE